MYQITVESINQFKRVEWRETVEAKSKAAATRKANLIVKDAEFSSLEAISVNKFTNKYDSTMEIWQLI